MSTILISLVVVGACFAVVLWITIGSVSQPATKEVKAAYGEAPRPTAVVIPVESGVPLVDGDEVAAGAEVETEAGADAAVEGADEVEVAAGDEVDVGDRSELDDPDVAAAPVLVVTTDDLGPDDAEGPDEQPEPAIAPDPEDAAAPEVSSPERVALPAASALAVERATTAPAAPVAPYTLPPARPAGAEAAVGGPVTRAPVARRRRVVALPGSYSFSPVPPVTAGRRLRSALGVLVVVTVVGLGLAAAVGVLVVAISRALESAVS